MEDFIYKNVQVEKSVWDRLKKFCTKPSVRRDPGKQAGFIIKEYLDNNKTMEETWQMLIKELDVIIRNTELSDTKRANKLFSKRASLELALNRCRGVE